MLALVLFLQVFGSATALAQARGVPLQYAWSSEIFGSGTDGPVHALAEYQGDLIVAGDFTTMDGVTVNGIARFDGIAWWGLEGPSGTGVDGFVDALVVFAGELVVGGEFDTAGGVLVNNVARWNGGEWGALAGSSGVGATHAVRALIEFDGDLVVGGAFSQAGGINASRIARWDGDEWAMLSGTPQAPDSTVLALEVFEGDLIVGGNFNSVGALTARYVASWNGSTWSSLSGPGGGVSGNGTNSTVWALTVYEGALIAGGFFTTAGGSAADRVASWDGDNWSSLSGPVAQGASDWVRTVAVYDGDLVAGGEFELAGGETVNRVARWDGTAWSGLPGPSGTGMDDSVLTLMEFDGWLIAGGGFTAAGGLSAPNLSAFGIQSFSVGGSVSGLAGSGLMLQNNGGDDLPVGENGSFTFPTPLADGSGYQVTVLSQPENPLQLCLVANGSGTLAGSDVADVTVTCLDDGLFEDRFETP